jgi:PAS domain S-box-containing protein
MYKKEKEDEVAIAWEEEAKRVTEAINTNKEHVLAKEKEKLVVELTIARKELNLQINERKLAEEALLQSSIFSESILKTIPFGMDIVDETGTVLFQSDKFKRIFGVDVIGKKCWELYRDDKKQCSDCPLVKGLTIGETETYESYGVLGNRIYEISHTGMLYQGKKALLEIFQDITENKKAENLLKESESKYRDLVENSPDAIIVHQKGEVVFANRESLRTMGAESLCDLNKKSLIEFVHPDFRDLAIERIKKLQNSENVVSTTEERFIRLDGSEIDVEVTGMSIDYKNKPAIQLIIHNITDRKLSEKEVRETNNRFLSLAQNISGYIAYVNANTLKYEFVNDMYEKAFGISKDKIIGCHIKDMLEETNYQFALKYINKVKSGESCSYENIFNLAFGERWLQVNYSPIFDSKGNVKSIAILNYDITERKQTEKSLQRSEHELKKAQQITHIGSWYLDVATNEVIWTEELYKMYGFDPKLPPPPYTEHMKLFTPESWEILSTSIAKTTETGVLYELELQTVRKDGSNGWMWVRGEAQKDSDGKIVSLWGAAQDISEQKDREIRLEEALEKAMESDRLKSTFLTNMSHEIRTPMNGILGFAELLKEPNLTSDDQQDFIQTIQISGARMLNTINSIVDISKIESGLINVDIKETNINEKIEFTYKFFKPEVEIKELQFLFKNGLPTNEANIKTDNEKVYGILTNLVRNAIKFTYEGSIEFGYEKKGEYLEFYVKDTGIGIPKKQQKFIFERFRQGSESNNRGYEGSGLGLSIAKSYIDMLGGKIWVESEEGLGTTFYFTIPYDTVSEEKAEIIDSGSTEHKEVGIKNLKILIVEDDEISYSLLSKTLQKISKKVLHAITGVEAVEACRNNPDLDLVLMDIRMPRMDGNEATRHIRKFNKEVIIIAQSAYAFADDKEKAIEAGCDDYISKPINSNLLIALILKYINKL